MGSGTFTIAADMNRREVLAAMLAGPLLGVRALAAQSSDLTALTIAEAAARLASGSITPLQLTNAYLSRIAAVNKSINAYVTVTADLARREARTLPAQGSRMWGIPIAHKDLFETKGIRTTAGSMLYQDNIPEENAAIVQQLEQAGAVMLGKTNTHELGGGVTTINPFFGTTRNPIDLARIAGGSSGGSAAAVVAHLCAAATGSDTGGSVRIPAAFCGCVGFKPTFGKFSTQGLIGASATFDHVGFLTRTVEDAQIIAGLTPSKRRTNPRIAVARNYFFDDLEPAVASAINPLIAVPLRSTFRSIPRRWRACSIRSWRSKSGDGSAPTGGTIPDRSRKTSRHFLPRHGHRSRNTNRRSARSRNIKPPSIELFDSVDVIVTPTVPVTAPLITSRIDGTKILRNTWPFNAAGTPAVSIPVMSKPHYRWDCNWWRGAARTTNSYESRAVCSKGSDASSGCVHCCNGGSPLYLADAIELNRRSFAFVLIAFTLTLAAAVRADAGRPQGHLAENVLRTRHRRRLRAAELHQVHRVREEARCRKRSHDRAVDRQDRRRPRSADGDHHRAGELQEARSLQGDLARACRTPRA